jgi:K+-transporting ATPase KdpF subunit
LVWSQPAIGFDLKRMPEESPVIYSTAVVAALALIYLVYVMIRPERF